MPNLRQRKWLLIAIAIAVVVLLTAIAAPNSGGTRIDSGSTYGRNPDGYGAWYRYMSHREVPIERWRQPFSRLIEEDVRGVTYIQIGNPANLVPNSIDLSAPQQKWVSLGNTLVILGVARSATAAPFESSIPDRERPLLERQIKIATTRRYRQPTKGMTKTILGDRYGAVVWQESIGKGKVIYSTTPYLAANAYQDYLDNYRFLADLVSDNEAIWVDEYTHGYKDKETIAREQQEDIFSYLAKTPWLMLFIQIVIMVGLASLTALRRFGRSAVVKNAIAHNSTAYIDALAGVLQKANSTDFVVDAIGKDERRKLQLSLGLGKTLVDEATLVAAWEQQNQQPATELNQVLQIERANQKISDAQLIVWLQKWQKLAMLDN